MVIEERLTGLYASRIQRRWFRKPRVIMVVMVRQVIGNENFHGPTHVERVIWRDATPKDLLSIAFNGTNCGVFYQKEWDQCARS